MDKFSKLFQSNKKLKDDDNYLWKGSYIKIKELDGWEGVCEKDCIVAIVYLLEHDELVLRKEYVPTYNWVNKKEFYLTILSGAIEEGETAERTLIRELEEEAGIKLHTHYRGFKKLNQLFFNKGCTAQYHIYYVPLNDTDYEKVLAKGDGSEIEDKSISVRIDVKFVKNLNPSDTITALCLEYFKNI